MKPLNLTTRNRALVAIALGAIWAGMSAGIQRGSGPARLGGDFTYPWFAARGILRGFDPYLAAKTAPLPWGKSLFYPLPAGIIALPFAWLGARLASAIFVGLCSAIAAFVVTRKTWWPLAIFLSAQAYGVAAGANGWPMLLIAASIAAPLCVILIAKPNIGLAPLVYQRSWRALAYAAIGGGVLLAISLVILPRWPVEWIATFNADPLHAQYRPPIVTLFGFPIALATIRWRDTRAQYLLALACLPQHIGFYDQLLILLVAESRVELLVLCCGSWLAWAAALVFGAPQLPAIVVGCFWPAVGVVVAPWFREARMRESLRESVRAWVRQYWLTAIVVTLVLAASLYAIFTSNPVWEHRVPPGP